MSAFLSSHLPFSLCLPFYLHVCLSIFASTFSALCLPFCLCRLLVLCSDDSHILSQWKFLFLIVGMGEKLLNVLLHTLLIVVSLIKVSSIMTHSPEVSVEPCWEVSTQSIIYKNVTGTIYVSCKSLCTSGWANILSPLKVFAYTSKMQVPTQMERRIMF